MTTTTIPTIQPQERDTALPAPGTVPVLDRVAMRVGLALLLWGRSHAARAHGASVAERPFLFGDAGWRVR